MRLYEFVPALILTWQIIQKDQVPIVLVNIFSFKYRDVIALPETATDTLMI